MRSIAVALFVVAAAGATGCSDLTRPDEILIIAEPPPAPKPAPVKAPPAAVAKDDGASPGKPAKKAGG